MVFLKRNRAELPRDDGNEASSRFVKGSNRSITLGRLRLERRRGLNSWILDLSAGDLLEMCVTNQSQHLQSSLSHDGPITWKIWPGRSAVVFDSWDAWERTEIQLSWSGGSPALVPTGFWTWRDSCSHKAYEAGSNAMSCRLPLNDLEGK